MVKKVSRVHATPIIREVFNLRGCNVYYIQDSGDAFPRRSPKGCRPIMCITKPSQAMVWLGCTGGNYMYTCIRYDTTYFHRGQMFNKL